MSREHVRVFRHLIGALNAADFDAVYACLDPDVVYYSRADEPDALVGGDMNDVKAMIATWSEMFERFRCDIQEVVDDGGPTIFVTALRGTGRESGAEVDEPYVFVTAWRDDKIVEVHEYRSKTEAVEAAKPLR